MLLTIALAGWPGPESARTEAVPEGIERTARLGTHADAPCGDCHSAAGSGEHGIDPAFVSNSCRGCHAPADGAALGSVSAVGTDFHGNPDRACTDCHSYHRPRALTALGESFEYDFHDPAAAYVCLSCHVSEGSALEISPGHRLAAEMVYHVDSNRLLEQSPSQSCMGCHSAGGYVEGFASLEPMPAGMPRIDEHASHVTGVVVVSGKGGAYNHIRHEIHPRLALFENRIECQTCHVLTSADADLLVPFEPRYALCQGCHQHNR